MSDTKLCEPLLVIKRARRFYGPFYTIVKILQFYIAVILIMLDKPYTPIVGWIMLIGFFYAEIIPNCFKFIACYDDRIIVRYFFWERDIPFDEIKYFWVFTYFLGHNKLFIKLKFSLINLVLNICSIVIPMVYITKEDFEKLKILMSNKNIEYNNFI